MTLCQCARCILFRSAADEIDRLRSIPLDLRATQKDFNDLSDSLIAERSAHAETKRELEEMRTALQGQRDITERIRAHLESAEKALRRCLEESPIGRELVEIADDHLARFGGGNG